MVFGVGYGANEQGTFVIGFTEIAKNERGRSPVLTLLQIELRTLPDQSCSR